MNFLHGGNLIFCHFYLAVLLGKTPKDQRVVLTSKDRGSFIKEWYDRGYQTPKGGWDKYDIHHIQPREFGGINNFNNLVQVERNTGNLTTFHIKTASELAKKASSLGIGRFQKPCFPKKRLFNNNGLPVGVKLTNVVFGTVQLEIVAGGAEPDPSEPWN